MISQTFPRKFYLKSCELLRNKLITKLIKEGFMDTVRQYKKKKFRYTRQCFNMFAKYLVIIRTLVPSAVTLPNDDAIEAFC